MFKYFFNNLRVTWENTPNICFVTVVTSNLCCFGISSSPGSFKAKTASDNLRDTSAFWPGFLYIYVYILIYYFYKIMTLNLIIIFKNILSYL